MLIDPTSADEVGAALVGMAATATDLLLVYDAGHGLVDDRGRLHLALAHTHPDRARWTALPPDLLREEIATSVAATRVLVLDCCFSGRAIEAMADNQGVISGQLDVAGTYTRSAHQRGRWPGRRRAAHDGGHTARPGPARLPCGAIRRGRSE